MLGLAFASVPLYRAFCQATGFGGTTAAGANGARARSPEQIGVRFDANVDPELPWRFEPEQDDVSVAPGAKDDDLLPRDQPAAATDRPARRCST